MARSWEATYMLALGRRGPQRLHAHPPPPPLLLLCCGRAPPKGNPGSRDRARRTLRHALSGDFIGFPGSCSSAARGAAQGGPRGARRGVQERVPRAGARLTAAGSARRRTFLTVGAKGSGEQSRVAGGPSLRGWNGSTRRVQSLRRAVGQPRFPPGLRCGSAQPPGWPPL